MPEQRGYYGKPRKFYSWGYEGEEITPAEVKKMADKETLVLWGRSLLVLYRSLLVSYT